MVFYGQFSLSGQLISSRLTRVTDNEMFIADVNASDLSTCVEFLL